MAITAHSITEKKAEEILLSLYGIDGIAHSLVGEIDFNFRIDVESKPTYLLKISRPESMVAEIEFQNQLLQQLQMVDHDLDIPTVQNNLEGNSMSFFNDNTGRISVRLLSWISGRLWSSVNPLTPKLRKELGGFCGKR